MENQPSTSIGTSGAGSTGSTNGIGSSSSLGTSSASVVDRLAQSAHDTVDRVAAKAGPALEKLRSSAYSTREQLNAKAGDFGAIEEQWVESARGYVREHPFAAVAVAALAGMVIARLTSSR